MKHVMVVVSLVLWFTSVALAEESSKISQQAMEEVRQHAREMGELGVQQEQAQKMFTQMVRNQFRQQNVARARQIVESAARAGLPTAPVMSKAMEGMAKGVDEARILAAMDQVRSRHAYGHQMARELSEEKKGRQQLAGAIADSLAAGMTPRDMEKVKAQLQARARKTKTEDREHLPMQTMLAVRTMARMGAASSDVSDTLCQAIQNRYSWQEMKSLRTRVARQAHRSSPQQVAHQHAGAIGKGHRGGNANAGQGSGPGDGESGNGSGGQGGGGHGGGGQGSGGGDGDGGDGDGGSSGGAGGGGHGGGDGGGNGGGHGGGGPR